MTLIYLIGAGILTIILVIFTFVFQIHKTSHNLPKPPGKTGWPIIGETFIFLSNPRKFFSERMTKYSSDVFTTSLAGEKVVVFCGPKANKCIFANEGKLVKFWLPASVVAVVSQPQINSSNKMSKTQNEPWFKFVRADSIQRHLPVVYEIAKEHVATHWESKEVVKVYELAKEFMLVTCLRLFLNYSCSSEDELREIRAPFYFSLEGLFSVPINLPGTAYNKAITGSTLFKERIVEIIKKIKKTMSKQENLDNDVGKDLLSMYMTDYLDDNDDSSDQELATQVLGFMFAGTYSTSTTIAFAIAHLADNPHIYDMVLKEQQEIANSKELGEPLTTTDLQKMKHLWNVICETLRLKPPVVGTFRTAITDFTYAGFQILKGCKVFWTPYTTHMDPKYFKDPKRFNPSRFENIAQTPFSFVPFGGGTRSCPGKDFARIVTLTFMHHVVTKYKFVRVNPDEKIIFKPDPIPTEGLPVYLHPHVK